MRKYVHIRRVGTVTYHMKEPTYNRWTRQWTNYPRTRVDSLPVPKCGECRRDEKVAAGEWWVNDGIDYEALDL